MTNDTANSAHDSADASAHAPLDRAAEFLRLTRVRAVDRHLVRGSRLTPVLAEWIARAGRAVGLDRSLIAPLFHLCWVHRAVKEAARLPADRPGIYGPLSTRLVTARDAPGLRRLLAG